MSLHPRISRRTVLRGMGAMVALPLLEGMQVQSVFGAGEAAKPAVRLAFLAIPNGVNVEAFTPTKEGTDWELPDTLQPLAKFKSDINVFSGLTLNGGRPLGDGAGDHARSAASFLTGAHPVKTAGADIKNGQSVDQVAAERIGHLTRFPSLELGIERSAQAGNCDSGYSCAYSSNIAWRNETSPLAKEIDPRAVFDRLFGVEDRAEMTKTRVKRDKYKKSVLDFVLEDAKGLQKNLGSSDQRKLDEYLYAVREIEQRLVRVEKLGTPKDDESPNYPRPAGVPRDFSEHVRLMFDLMALAFQTDQTRVISFMYANEGSNRSYAPVEVKEGHHELSHHGRNKEKLEKIARIDKYHVAEFNYLLEKLAGIQENGQRLLDNCLVMIGSGLGDGDRHNHDNLPIVLAGRGGGNLPTGRHVKFPTDTPLTNLYRSMLERAGAPVEKFSDSTGPLKGLEG
jgi:hypothetical protein